MEQTPSFTSIGLAETPRYRSIRGLRPDTRQGAVSLRTHARWAAGIRACRSAGFAGRGNTEVIRRRQRGLDNRAGWDRLCQRDRPRTGELFRTQGGSACRPAHRLSSRFDRRGYCRQIDFGALDAALPALYSVTRVGSSSAAKLTLDIFVVTGEQAACTNSMGPVPLRSAGWYRADIGDLAGIVDRINFDTFNFDRLAVDAAFASDVQCSLRLVQESASARARWSRSALP